MVVRAIFVKLRAVQHNVVDHYPALVRGTGWLQSPAALCFAACAFPWPKTAAPFITTSTSWCRSNSSSACARRVMINDPVQYLWWQLFHVPGGLRNLGNGFGLLPFADGALIIHQRLACIVHEFQRCRDIVVDDGYEAKVYLVILFELYVLQVEVGLCSTMAVSFSRTFVPVEAPPENKVCQHSQCKQHQYPEPPLLIKGVGMVKVMSRKNNYQCQSRSFFLSTVIKITITEEGLQSWSLVHQPPFPPETTCCYSVYIPGKDFLFPHLGIYGQGLCLHLWHSAQFHVLVLCDIYRIAILQGTCRYI